MYGLKKGEKLKEIIVKKDESIAIRYRVVEEVIDLNTLRTEKTQLEIELSAKEPNEQELIAEGKLNHAFYVKNKTVIQARIDEINKILEK